MAFSLTQRIRPYVVQPDLLRSTSWAVLPHIGSQFLRLGSNIVLAWLLAPQLFGTMLLINTLRTGTELLTDVGIGQSIVNNPRGREADFYNTAWTIQILRGIVLFVLALALTVPIASIYDNKELLVLLPAVAPIFLLTGFTSPARFLLQKAVDVRKLGIFDIGVQALSISIQILLAWFMPNIWALIFGLLFGAFVTTIGSFFLMDWRTLRFRLHADSVRSIIHFGKWIFISSLTFFLAMNFDRLYFADMIPLAMLGIYGIARTYADTIMQVFARIGQLLVFPKVSASAQRGEALRQRVRPIRIALLGAVAVGLALAACLADEFILLLYDDRYDDAGILLTLLLLGTWFGILATISDAMMMGVSKPSGVAFGNGAKFLIIIVGLPLLLPTYGFAAAVALLVGAEAVRYGVLVLGQRKVGLGFTRQDIAMTLFFLCLLLGFRELTMLVGLTQGFSGWVEQVEQLDV